MAGQALADHMEDPARDDGVGILAKRRRDARRPVLAIPAAGPATGGTRPGAVVGVWWVVTGIRVRMRCKLTLHRTPIEAPPDFLRDLSSGHFRRCQGPWPEPVLQAASR